MKKTSFSPENYLIFEAITGSRLYGVHREDSDYDYRGVCIPPMDVLLNPFMSFNQKDSGFTEEDRTIYALGQFFKLCSGGNPNIVEFLFINEENIKVNTDAWRKIVENRHLFLSKVIRHRFSGYAFSQIARIERHRKWFIDPPKEKPTRKMFGLKGSPDISLAWLEAVKTTHNLKLIDDKYKGEFQKEQDYRTAKKSWDNYMAWKKGRNPSRRELEEKFGYDCKHASHVFRLMTEGKELLLTGNITFPLRNAEEIFAVKNGKYEYEELLSMAKKMDKEFDIWYDKSPLPHKPNINALTNLYFSIIMKK